jgi:hypothetical protein
MNSETKYSELIINAAMAEMEDATGDQYAWTQENIPEVVK